MELFNQIIESIIFVLFPITIYYIIVANEKNLINEKKNNYLETSLLTSIYLLLNFNSKYTVYLLLILNVPLFISLKNNNKIFSIFLSFILILINIKLNINIYISFLIYLEINFVYYLLKNNFKLYLIIQSILFIFLYYQNIYINIILSIIFLLVCYIIFNLINSLNKIINLNYTFNELEKEKKIKQSLFQITHEVKNPLTVCKGYLQMLDGNNDINCYKKYCNIINSEIEKSLLILEDFKKLNKIDVVKTNMNICALLDDVVESFNFNIKYDLDKDIYINGDYDRLKQVFLNIVKNSIEASATEIEINVKETKQYLYIYIIDNGIGIDKNDIEKICDSFYTTKSNGTGLGLYISQEIVERHNGTIKYESNKGTKCIVKLKK